MTDGGREFWLTGAAVLILGTAIAFALGIRESWPYILVFGVLAVGALAFLTLGVIELRRRRRRL